LKLIKDQSLYTDAISIYETRENSNKHEQTRTQTQNKHLQLILSFYGDHLMEVGRAGDAGVVLLNAGKYEQGKKERERERERERDRKKK